MKMKTITLKALVIVAGVLSAAGAFAQNHALTANVPFAFSVDNQVLPAGRYEIQTISNEQIPGGVIVRNIDHPRYTVLVLASNGQSQALPNHVITNGRLVFNNYDGKYFLREARGTFNAVNADFPVTKSEKSVQRQKQALLPTQAIVVAGQ